MKNFLIITALLVIVHVTVFGKPPTFLWDGGNCWANASLQLLQQIKPATEEILQRYKAGTLGNNAFLKAYAERLLDPKDETKSENFNLACGKQKKEWGSLEDFFDKLEDPNVKILFWPYIGFKSKLLEGEHKGEEASLMWSGYLKFATEALHFKQKKELYLQEIKRISNYLLLFLYCPMLEIRKSIDMTTLKTCTLSPELKKKSNDWNYDLIGIIKKHTDHFRSYVKDQFEESPKWYYCHGKNYHCKLIQEQDLPSKLNNSESMLLYKKRKPDLDWNKEDAAAADIQSLADALHTLLLQQEPIKKS